MHDRCPHCETQIHLIAEASIETTTCPECGRFIDDIVTSDTVNRTLNPDEPTDVASPAVATTFVPRLKSSDTPLTDAIQFGDYEIVNEIARGGMGVVYKAKQKSLNRIVAIKMILSGHLASEKDIKRFRSEAEAVAGLDHPNIVPVYEVGEIENQHFFSMGFVDGRSLALKLADGPLRPREAVELTETIAKAIEYSHRKGIVHRDLKPGNILLDNNGHPKVSDFGLAKQIDIESSISSTGQILGTPSYMAPEQAAGKINEVGRLSDVYSLGAILYCLVTGRPPFQAATAYETLKQVLQQEPVLPRLLNHAVEKDLETICLKCLQKEPEKRYDSAKELADDLNRFLNHKPVLARPIGNVARLVRWTKRNRLLASMSGIVAVVLLTGTVISTSFAIETKAALTEAIEANEKKDTALIEKKEALKETHETIYNYVETVQNADLLKEERFKPLMKKLLKDAFAYYEDFIESHEHDEESFHDIANALIQVARFSEESGDIERGIDSYRRSIEILEELVTNNPDEIEYQDDLGISYNNIGIIYRMTQERDASLSSYKKSIELFERLAKKNPGIPEFRNKLARSYNNVGLLLESTRKTKQAYTWLLEAFEMRKKLAEEYPSNARFQTAFAASHSDIALFLKKTGKRLESQKFFEEAIQIFEQIALKYPEVNEYQLNYAKGLNNMGLSYRSTGQSEKALVSFEKAIEMFEIQVEKNPTMTSHRVDLAGCLYNSAYSYQLTAQPVKGLKAYRNAIKMFDKLVVENETVLDYKSRLVGCWIGKGRLHQASGDSNEAILSYQIALEITEMLTREDPGEMNFLEDVAISCTNLGHSLKSLGRSGKAIAYYKRAVEIRKQLVQKNPNSIPLAISLGGLSVNMANLAHTTKDYVIATVFYNLGVSTLGALLTEHPGQSEAKLYLRNAHWGRAGLMQTLERFDEAIKDLDKAIELDSGKMKAKLQLQRYVLVTQSGLQKLKMRKKDSKKKPDAKKKKICSIVPWSTTHTRRIETCIIEDSEKRRARSNRDGENNCALTRNF